MAEGSYDQLWDLAWEQAASIGPGFQSRYGLLLRLMADLGVSGRLLEVGAGRGHFLQRAHERFPDLRLSAHENAPGALDRLRELDCLEDVFSGAIESSGVAAAPGFHVIVCSEVLEHIERHEEALDVMTDLLEPGGRLFLTVPLRPGLWNQVDAAVGHKRRYRRGQLDEMCRERGLEIEHSLAGGFPFYNTYYRLLGSRSPQETARSADRPTARLAAHILTRLFSLESRWSTPLGCRGTVIARKVPSPLS